MKNKKHFYHKGKKASIIFSGMAKYDLSEICRICSDFLKMDQPYHRTTAGIVHVTCANNFKWLKYAPPKYQAAKPYSNGNKLELVARDAKISVRTLHRWLSDDDLFVRRFRELRRAAVEQGIARVQGLFDRAVDALETNLNTGNRPAEVRTAVSIIRQSLDGIDLLDLDSRIRVIEKRLDPKVK